ncbi:hypothetical protein COLO4_04385 [Corchorus olitorius]|uniref:Uncharacterized protein n=1 Tax=Corchorus olitorius TaxID=93759 RepID=A0A1R3KU55_9ROSI|nr:hypothetical protein COLO4_04385 [Corchorus olitorius]
MDLRHEQRVPPVGMRFERTEIHNANAPFNSSGAGSRSCGMGTLSRVRFTISRTDMSYIRHWYISLHKRTVVKRSYDHLRSRTDARATPGYYCSAAAKKR